MNIYIASFLLFFLGSIIGYLIGSISFSILISKKIFKKDIRELGSKNAGATNSTRVMGKKIGIIVLLLDLLKGIIPILFSWFMFHFCFDRYIDHSISVQNFNFGTLIYLSGFFAIIGHIFPVYHKFKGGKGIATAAGVYLMISPFILIVGIIIITLVVLIKKYVSLGSIICAIVLPFLILIPGINYFYLLFPKINTFTENILAYELNALFIFSFMFLISCLVIYKHKQNIIRLLNKQENKLVLFK